MAKVDRSEGIGRLEAFSDAVLAIVLTLLVLDLLPKASARIRTATPLVLVLNLGVLLGASLIPWPTALISAALETGDRSAQIGAIFVFALVSIILSVPWLALDLYLAHHPGLLRSTSDVKWMRAHAWASIGTIVGAVVSIGLAFVSPIASLVLYLVVSIVFIVLRLREGGPRRTSRAREN